MAPDGKTIHGPADQNLSIKWKGGGVSVVVDTRYKALPIPEYVLLHLTYLVVINTARSIIF